MELFRDINGQGDSDNALINSENDSYYFTFEECKDAVRDIYQVDFIDVGVTQYILFFTPSL